MDQQTLNLVYGLAVLVAIIGLLVAIYLQHRTINSLVVYVKNVNDTPAVISAIKGATEGVPQDAFAKMLSALATAKAFAPGTDAKALIEQLDLLIRRIDHDLSNDPGAEDLKTILLKVSGDIRKITTATEPSVYGFTYLGAPATTTTSAATVTNQPPVDPLIFQTG